MTNRIFNDDNLEILRNQEYFSFAGVDLIYLDLPAHCRYTEEECSVIAPRLLDTAADHTVACFLYDHESDSESQT